MHPWNLLILALIGLFGGTLSGIVGIGGAVVFVPGLIYIAGWGIREAVGASLVLTIFTALSGTLRGLRSEDPVDWKVMALMALAVAPSALVGVAISRSVPEVFVELVFATFLVLLAYPTFRGRSAPSERARGIPPVLVLLAGVGIGILAGFVGIGGAAMMVPLMSLGFGLRFKRSVSTSLAVNFFTGISGASGYLASGLVRIGGLPPLVLGAVFGAWLGVTLRDKLPETYIRRGFAALMLVTAVRLIVGAAGKL